MLQTDRKRTRNNRQAGTQKKIASSPRAPVRQQHSSQCGGRDANTAAHAHRPGVQCGGSVDGHHMHIICSRHKLAPASASPYCALHSPHLRARGTRQDWQRCCCNRHMHTPTTDICLAAAAQASHLAAVDSTAGHARTPRSDSGKLHLCRTGRCQTNKCSGRGGQQQRADDPPRQASRSSPHNAKPQRCQDGSWQGPSAAAAPAATGLGCMLPQEKEPLCPCLGRQAGVQAPEAAGAPLCLPPTCNRFPTKNYKPHAA